MPADFEYIEYKSTGAFSKIVTDYIKADEKLKPFYQHPVSLEGIKAAMEARKQFTTSRLLLVDELQEQYAGLQLNEKQTKHLQLLLQPNTFTVCTAHQPVIFLGPLYFIYKVLHTIRLAEYLQQELPENNFVPVFYMGSEDADIDELGTIQLNGEKLKWQTNQTGAVGRMKVDKGFIELLERVEGELKVEKHGGELIELFKKNYKPGNTIQQATLHLVNELFADYGLIILIPDNVELKRSFLPVIKKELKEQFSYSLVERTATQLSQHYKAQAGGREINLFYLIDDKRERIEKQAERFFSKALNKEWSEAAIIDETTSHPERFSPNVILRGLFQETILPNIAFIGGGAEIAYWLELQEVFKDCAVPFPVLILRNSFLLTQSFQQQKISKLGFSTKDLFQPANSLIGVLVRKESEQRLSLHSEKQQLQEVYQSISEATNKIAASLGEHTKALQAKAFKKLDVLEKKMLKAEKIKFEAQQRQINKLKQQLFPNNILQERTENFSSFYSKHGKDWLTELYAASKALEQRFCILNLGTES